MYCAHTEKMEKHLKAHTQRQKLKLSEQNPSSQTINQNWCYFIKGWNNIQLSAASLTVHNSNHWANTVHIPYLRTQSPLGGNYRETPNIPPRTLVNIHAPAATFLSFQLEFLISWLVLMEINGRSPWWIPTSSIIIPASVPVRSNYILKMPSVPQPPTPQDQSIILIFGCPPTPLRCLPSSSAFAPFFLLRACRYVSKENQTLKNKGWWVINHPSHLQAPLIPSFRLSVCSVVHPACFCLVPAMSFLPRPLAVWRMGGAFHSFPLLVT